MLFKTLLYFSFLEFGGFDYKVCDPYIINFPDGGYDKFYDFSLIDTTTREIVNLSRFLPADDGVLDKPFDPSKENVFISHGKLICIKENEAFGEKEYSIPKKLEDAVGFIKRHKTWNHISKDYNF